MKGRERSERQIRTDTKEQNVMHVTGKAGQVEEEEGVGRKWKGNYSYGKKP